MRIGLDARMLAHSGIGTYITHLIAGLGRDPGPHEYVIFTTPELAERVPACARFEVRPVRVPVYGVAEHLVWPRLLAAARCDLYHVPHYNVPLGFSAPLVVTIYDLIHVLFPELMRSRVQALAARLLLRNAVRRARGIIALSECTRSDLVRVLGARAERIAVIPAGVEPRFRPCPTAAVEAFRARLGLPSDFLLYVGLRRPHKNLLRLVRAFAGCRRLVSRDVKLVLRGARDARDAATETEIRALGLESDVLSIERRIEDEEMPLLYNAARGLALPSLYEGFGLPALEAMACGVPVLAARAGALPEVVGDAALLVDPLDVDALAVAMARLLQDVELRAQLVTRGPERASGFRWPQAVNRTRLLYESC